MSAAVMRSFILFWTLLVLGSEALAATNTSAKMAPNEINEATSCERLQRSVQVRGRPVVVSVTPGQFTEIVFPEKLVGILPEKPDGLSINQSPFPERVFVTVEKSSYLGIVIVQGESGETYHVSLLGHKLCGDSTVRIEHPETTVPKAPPEEAQLSGRKLMEYMMLGETPPSYQKEVASGSLGSRMVYQQGSVSFYLHEVYEGYNYTGAVLLAVNSGRVPYRVAVEAIDYSSKLLRAKLGRVREVSMFPYDFRLGPALEYAAEVQGASNQGLVFIVSDRWVDGNGG